MGDAAIGALTSDGKPVLLPGLPADGTDWLEMLARGWREPERSLHLQSLAEALAGDSRQDYFCSRFCASDRLAGVALAQRLPGRTAAVYPSQVADELPPESPARLLRSLEEQLAAAGIHLAQALLGLDQQRDEACFLAAGYSRAATLLYMACDASVFPLEPPALDLTLEPVGVEGEQRLYEAIEASYSETLDCPLLNGLRQTADVVAGYRGVGTYRPELWFLARRGGRDVGCLILADHPSAENLELVYVGLAPAARGSGYGLALTRQAQWLARQLGRQRLVLAVDAANGPAIQVYEQAGLFGFDQRLVLIKPLTAASAVTS